MKKLQFTYLLFALIISGTCNAQNTSFVVTGGFGKIYKLNHETCANTYLGNCGVDLLDIAITPSGKLYGIDGYKLYHIDTTSLAITLKHDMGIPLIEYYNSLFALNDDFLISVDNNARLVKFDITSGAKTVLGTLNYYSGGDITFYKGNFYLAGLGNELLKFDIDQEATYIINQELIGIMTTPIGNVYGITVVGEVDCINDKSKMYAFENDDVYLVNPDDATLTLICDSLNIDPAQGATSFNETLSQFTNLNSSMPNIFTPNNDGLNDSWYPNINSLEEITYEIFNRWGNKVFDNSISDFWSGEDVNGLTCTEGVYFFTLCYTNACTNQICKSGVIHLLR